MTKIKSAQEWAKKAYVAIFKDYEDFMDEESELPVVADIIRKAQAEAWEAGREAAAEFLDKEIKHLHANGMARENYFDIVAASSRANAIRALPNQFKESKGDE